MEIYSIGQSLPGHPDCGAIQIIYSIPPGIQVSRRTPTDTFRQKPATFPPSEERDSYPHKVLVWDTGRLAVIRAPTQHSTRKEEEQSGLLRIRSCSRESRPVSGCVFVAACRGNTICFCLLLLEHKARITLVSSRRSSANPQNTSLDYFYGSNFISSIKTCHSLRHHQGPEHPNPGQPYTCRGFPRFCFLPDNDKGRKVRVLSCSTPNTVEGAVLYPCLGRLSSSWTSPSVQKLFKSRDFKTFLAHYEVGRLYTTTSCDVMHHR